MSDVTPTPQQGFIALLLCAARDHGGVAVPHIEDGLATVEEEMFQEPERSMLHHISTLMMRGHIPSKRPLQACDPELFSDERLRWYARFEQDFGLIPQAAENVVREHRKKRFIQSLTSALVAAEKGDLETACTLIPDDLLDEPLGASEEDGEGFVSHVLDRNTDPRISTGLERLDELLGGGIGYQGRSVFSLWAAPSGVGKSSFMQGVLVPYWLSRGHWVYYFTGEASVSDVCNEVARMRGGVSYTQAKTRKEREIPQLEEMILDAARELEDLPGRFMVFDQKFDDGKIRLKAKRRKRELLLAKEEGRAHPDAQLIVVVDNLDHAVGAVSDRLREDQVFDQMGRRFVEHARRYEYHVAALAQINAEGAKRGGPAYQEDLAKSKILASHCHALVTLWRPTKEEDRLATETASDGRTIPARRARHLIATRKARSGKQDELELKSYPDTGVWYDAELTPAPF